MCAANLGSIWTKLWSDRSSFDHLGIWWSGWWTYLHNVMNSNEICVHISHVCPNFYWIFYELKDVPADFCNFSKYGASLLKFFHLNLNCIFVQSIRGVQRMETMTMERNVTYDAYEYSTSFPFERSFDQWHYKRWTEENWVSDSKTRFEMPSLLHRKNWIWMLCVLEVYCTNEIKLDPTLHIMLCLDTSCKMQFYMHYVRSVRHTLEDQESNLNCNTACKL